MSARKARASKAQRPTDQQPTVLPDRAQVKRRKDIAHRLHRAVALVVLAHDSIEHGDDVILTDARYTLDQGVEALLGLRDEIDVEMGVVEPDLAKLLQPEAQP